MKTFSIGQIQLQSEGSLTDLEETESIERKERSNAKNYPKAEKKNALRQKQALY